MELAGGAFLFLAFVILFLFAVIMSLFTGRGSGINHHAYRNVYGGAPGADLPCEDYSGADRTSVTEREVAQRWQPVERRERPAPAPREPSNRLPIRSPMGRLR